MKDLEHFDLGYPLYRPSILLIGDDASRALKLKRKLEHHGLRVYQTDVSSDELAKARQKYFELIVFDIKRLDANSCEVCRKIKADPELAEIPMVILTTCNDNSRYITNIPAFSVILQSCIWLLVGHYQDVISLAITS